jgi:protein gp37
MQKTLRITNITYDHIASDEQMKILKSFKKDFPLFAGFNNRTSGWFIKPQRKAIYDEIIKLVFAKWNESKRFNNNCPDWFVKETCIEFYANAFKRKLQEIEFEYLIKRYRRLENAVKKLHKETNV